METPDARPAPPRDGRAAARALLAGAVAAIAFTLYNGRANPDWVLTALFVLWVAAPFGGAALSRHAARQWPEASRHVTDAVAVSLAIVTTLAFALDSVRPFSNKGAFAYVVIPAAGWLFVAAGTLVAAVMARRGAG